MSGAAHFSDSQRTRRALLATIRHELRSPINAILGYSEMLLEDAATAGAEIAFIADLDKIHEAGGELLTRVNDILDPARIEVTDEDLAAFGTALRHELRTPVNTIIGYSEMLVEDAAGGGWSDAVPDLEHIHVAAAQFLALIEDVVMFHATEGDSVLPSSERAATTILVANAVRLIPAVEDVHPGHFRPDRHPILVVDDNEINRDLLSRRLERLGYRVAVAENGRIALEMARAQPYDLIMLDLLMPEMNGYEVLQVCMADAALRDIPVIIVSGLDEIDSIARCIEAGAEDYLTKPFNLIILRARVEACLEKKWLRDQEVEYLRNVALVTEAASAVEVGAFDEQSLAAVAAREDKLGQLARIFQRMAREVAAREERLKQQVRELSIQVDHTRTAKAVAEIADTEYFQQLQKRASSLRKRPE